MNPWMIDLVKDANERLFTPLEVERLIAFADTLPARLKLGEDLEKLESELVSGVVAELDETHPSRAGYTPAAIRDVVESLRHLFVAVFRDEPEFLDRRWTAPLTDSLRRCGLEADWAPAIYRAVDGRLGKQLRGPSLELYRPAMDRLMDALQPSAV